MKVYFEMPLVNDVVRFLIEHCFTKNFFLEEINTRVLLQNIYKKFTKINQFSNLHFPTEEKTTKTIVKMFTMLLDSVNLV